MKRRDDRLFCLPKKSEVFNISGPKYLNSPIPWVGGKRCFRDVIIQSFPEKYGRYVEVFGGSGTIMFAKQKDKFEVYNDFNGDLVNMFKCIKEKPISLIKELNHFPLHSRLEFNMLLDFLNRKEPEFRYNQNEIQVAEEFFEGQDMDKIRNILEGKAKMYDVERAAAFYKLIRYSYGSGGKNFGGQPVNLANTLMNLYAASSRLQEVVIECKDFESLIKVQDRPDTFFYLDPPYVDTEGHYMIDFPKEDHIRLYNCLKEIKGNFLLSYNDCEFIKELYKDYTIVEKSRANSLAHRYNPGSEFKELLIANYDINERRKSRPLQLSLFGVDDIYEYDFLKDYREKRSNHHTAYITYSIRNS